MSLICSHGFESLIGERHADALDAGEPCDQAAELVIAMHRERPSGEPLRRQLQREIGRAGTELRHRNIGRTVRHDAAIGDDVDQGAVAADDRPQPLVNEMRGLAGVVCCEDGSLDPIPPLLTTAEDRQGIGVAVLSLALEEALPRRYRKAFADGFAFLTFDNQARVAILALRPAQKLEAVGTFGLADMCRTCRLEPLSVPVGDLFPIRAVTGA